MSSTAQGPPPAYSKVYPSLTKEEIDLLAGHYAVQRRTPTPPQPPAQGGGVSVGRAPTTGATPHRAPEFTQLDLVLQSPVLGTPGGSPQGGALGGSDSSVSSSTTYPPGSEQGSGQEEQVDSSVRDMFL